MLLSMLSSLMTLPMTVGSSVGHGNETLSLAVTGVMAGAFYGLIGITLTLMVRSSGVLSFAHAGFSLLAAYMYSGFACPVPRNSGGTNCAAPTLHPIEAILVIVVVTTVVGLVVERLVLRPLQDASAVTKVVATAAVLALISGVCLEIYGPQPRAIPQSQQLIPSGGFSLGGAVVTWQDTTIFAFTLAAVVVLGWYLRRSWFGLAVRASGQRPEVAQLLGVTPARVSRFNWALGAALSAVAGILLAPIESVNIGTVGFLTIKSLGAVVLGGLVSLPLTFVGGLVIGLVEYVAPQFWKTQGSAEVVLLAVLVAAMIYHRRRLAGLSTFTVASVARHRGNGRVAFAAPIAGLSVLGRRVPRPIWVLVGVGLVLVPLHNDYFAAVGVNSLYYGLMALSMVVIAGMTGQVSFVQGGFVGVGAFTLSTGLSHHWSIITSGLVALVVCAVLGAVIGIVTLRFRNVEFIIVTLACSAAITDYLLNTKTLRHPLLASSSTLGISLLSTRNLYLFSLVFVVVAVIAVANVMRSGWGRSIRAMNELGGKVGHFGLDPIRASTALFTLSAVIAGLAGCISALVLTAIDTVDYTPLLSVTIVLAAVVGGLRTIWGALAAALVFGAGQQIIANLVSSNSANSFPEIASAGLAIVIVVFTPSGIAKLGGWAETTIESSTFSAGWWWRGSRSHEELELVGETATGVPVGRPRNGRLSRAAEPNGRVEPAKADSARLGRRWLLPATNGVGGRALTTSYEVGVARKASGFGNGKTRLSERRLSADGVSNPGPDPSGEGVMPGTTSGTRVASGRRS